MKSRLCTSLFLGLLATGAANGAECPNSEKAKDGFTLERPGVRSQFRSSAGMVVHVANTYEAAPPQTQFFFGGLIEVLHLGEKGQFSLVPLSDLRSIFPLKSGARHKIAFLRLMPKEKAGVQQTLELQITGKEKFSLGTCEYDVLSVKQFLKDANGEELDAWTSLYAPDLQAVLAKRYDEGSARETTIGYETIKPLAD
jgi:hypothetical protein